MHIDCPCLNRHGDIPCRCQQKVSRADMPGMVEQRNEQLIFCGCQVDAAALPLNREISFIDGQIFIILHPEHPTYHNRQSAPARFPTPSKRLRRQEKSAPTGCCRHGAAKARKVTLACTIKAFCQLFCLFQYTDHPKSGNPRSNPDYPP